MLQYSPRLLVGVLRLGYAQLFDLARQHRVNHHAFSDRTMDSTQFSVQETEFTGQKKLLWTERQMSVVDDHEHASIKWQQNRKLWSCFDTEYDSSLWLSFVLEQCCVCLCPLLKTCLLPCYSVLQSQLATAVLKWVNWTFAHVTILVTVFVFFVLLFFPLLLVLDENVPL